MRRGSFLITAAAISRSLAPSFAMSSSSRFRSWPITETAALHPSLKEMGLKLPASAIDGTSSAAGDAISDTLCSVGPAGRGGTGSFISADGLIITNHHVALDAVRQASISEGRDLLAEGFVASSMEDEIAGPDYEVWITRECQDVSDRFVAVRSEADPLKRANAVRDLRQAIAREAEEALAAKEQQAAAAGTEDGQQPAQSKSVRCEVQEMWADKTYVLFTYQRFTDVRIVYVPPMSLGCFGGDVDNFEFPRHTADFTLLRAYVPPPPAAAGGGGQGSDVAKNIPYRPRKYLRASPEGAKEGDFVFLLGFPGSTMRYAPAARLAYTMDVAVPNLVKDFGDKLRLIKEKATDRASALKLAKAKKGLANEHKRSLGKSVMMRKLGLMQERRAEEAALVAAAPAAAPLLQRIGEIYGALRETAAASEVLDEFRGM